MDNVKIKRAEVCNFSTEIRHLMVAYPFIWNIIHVHLGQKGKKDEWKMVTSTSGEKKIFSLLREHRKWESAFVSDNTLL